MARLSKKQWNTIKMLVRRRITAEENRLRRMANQIDEEKRGFLEGKINDLLDIEEKLEEISPTEALQRN